MIEDREKAEGEEVAAPEAAAAREARKRGGRRGYAPP